MHKITIEPAEVWNEATNTFSSLDKPVEIVIEHSLVSLSKWESIWHKPYFDPRSKGQTWEEFISYVKCMTMTQNVDPFVYNFISKELKDEILRYLDDPQTATWFSEEQRKGNAGGTGEIITSELIYYWMISYNIPIEAQKWPINRLLTLIRICNVKQNEGNKKNGKTQKEINQQAYNLNAKRRAMKKH